MKHLLTIEQLSLSEISECLSLAQTLKDGRGKHAVLPLKDQIWALLFTKPSTRTRVSFEVGIRELGGSVVYLSASEIQMGRGESVTDTARTLSRYLQGIVIRTFAQNDVEEFARVGSIPVINALTDDEHPCQILADLLTIKERIGDLSGKKVVFLGDGACNISTSWIFAAARMGIELWVAAPNAFQPSKEIIKRAGGKIIVTDDAEEAAQNADVLYTDVWVSMGKEEEAADRLDVLWPYQLNRALADLAKPDALVLHCLPAYVGKEISAEVFESNQQTIFDQAENRLHAQKAVLSLLTKRRKS